MKLTDLQLYQENNKYYLSAKLLHEDKKGYYEASIPKIDLHISRDCEVNISSGHDCFGVPYKMVDIDLGFGLLCVKPFNEKGDFITMTCLEEKVHEMTLDEIENELGYKIKLKKESRPC